MRWRSPFTRLTKADRQFAAGTEGLALRTAADAVRTAGQAVVLAKLCVCENTFATMAVFGIPIRSTPSDVVASLLASAFAELDDIDRLIEDDWESAIGHVQAAYEECREARNLAAGHDAICGSVGT